MKKYLFALFLFLGLLSCQKEKKSFSSLLNFIPQETAVVLKTEDLREFSAALSKNSFLSEHELSIQQALQKKLMGLDFIGAQDESLLCFSLLGRDVVYAFITKSKPDLIPDSAKKKAEQFQYGNQTIKKYSLQGNIIYSVVLSDVFIASGSKLIVENMIRLFNIGLPQQVSFQKVYGSASANASLFIQNEKFHDFYRHFFPKGNSSFLDDFSGWTALDVDIEETGIFLNGVLSEKNSIKNTLDYFQGMIPQKNELAQIVPLNAIGFYAFTYSDFSMLQENLRQTTEKKKLPAELDGLFSSINEIGVVYFSKGNVVVLNSKNLNKTESALLSQREVVDEFRGQSIFSFSEKDVFYQAFYPLLKMKELNFYTQLGQFFVFSKELKPLENIIAQHQNASVLAVQPFFKNTSENLSDESSILLMGINKNLKLFLSKKTKEVYKTEIAQMKMDGYKLSALQFVQSEGFAHVNFSFQKTDAENVQKRVTQIMALNLENPLVGNPQFFQYWRTGEQYIVAQDTKNNLYLFYNKGELRWKKSLNGRILGNIQTVDIFKNTRLQMAFVTPHKFYVVDRNGNNVEPFPIAFNETITQPLAVFDYANNRNYRFVITQDKTITMLDSHAENISGFTFEQTKTSALQAPKHIRIGTKDYLLIPETSGKLNILNRQGKPRIVVEKKIDFSENEWFLYKGKFTSTNAKGNLVQIDKKGNVSNQDLDLLKNHRIDATANTLVSISENILTIKDNEIALDYGLYSKPQIFYIDDTIYVAITDTQARKVYLFNSKGELLPGFPVYGNSMIDLGNMDNEGKLEFVVKGEENSVLVYRLD